MGGRAPGMDDTFGDPFVVEVHDFLAQMEIVEQRRTPLADPETVVGVVNRDTCGRRESFAALCPNWGDGLAGRSQRRGRPPPPCSRSRWTRHDCLPAPTPP